MWHQMVVTGLQAAVSKNEEWGIPCALLQASMEAGQASEEPWAETQERCDDTWLDRHQPFKS